MLKYKALVNDCSGRRFTQAYAQSCGAHILCGMQIPLTFLKFPWDWQTRAFHALEMEHTFYFLKCLFLVEEEKQILVFS